MILLLNIYKDIIKMNNEELLVNMSEYQKIIFVNNIDEYTGIRENLLTDPNYNFAVFFTNSKTYENNEKIVNYAWDRSFGDNIINMWYRGQRLNRFIGVDDNSCKINVGGHELKLVFNYNTGLISIIDVNQIRSIGFGGITYIDINGATNNLNEGIVDAINNKFYLNVIFDINNIKQTNINEETNINEINKELDFIFDSKNPNVRPIGEPEKISVVSNDNDNIIAVYRYTYKIIRDTFNTAESDNKYTITSRYDTNCSFSGNLYLRLNPTMINVYNISRGNESLRNISVLNDDFSESNRYLPNGKSKPYNESSFESMFDYKIKIYPNDDNIEGSHPISNENRKIRVKITSSNTNIVKVYKQKNTIPNDVEGDVCILSNNDAGINDSEVFFSVFCKRCQDNYNETSQIMITLEYKNYNETEWHTYNNDNLIKSFNVTVFGRNNYDYIYYGFDNPMVDNVTPISHYDFGAWTILYDYYTSKHRPDSTVPEDSSRNIIELPVPAENYVNSSFYIAIPEKRLDNIEITWDAYELDLRSDLTNDDNTYLDAGRDQIFDDLGEKIINNVSYRIYKSKNEFVGPFKGKIQKNNRVYN